MAQEKTHRVVTRTGKKFTIDGTPIKAGAELGPSQVKLMNAYIADLRKANDPRRPAPVVELEPISSGSSRPASSGGSGS